MPLVEYRCTKCGHVTEVLARSGKDPAPVCEECGGKKVEKLFSAFSARVAVKEPPARCATCPSSESCPMR